MTPERWQHVARVYQGALEQDDPARAAYLAEACRDDVELRREVESLLAQASASVLVDRPVWDAAAGLMPPSPDLKPGTVIGPYRIGALLGVGGMGQVYRAHDTRLQREVALKILPEAFVHDPDRLARFTREAHVLASLNHPNIAAIYGFEESHPATGSGQAAVRALVLELVEGETLAERLGRSKDRPLPEPGGRRASESPDDGSQPQDGRGRPSRMAEDGRGRGSASPEDGSRLENGRGRPSGRPIPLDEALPIARQIAEALEAAHEHGVIHRDLKPANIKLRDDGTVKVLDFGLAKALAPEPGSAAAGHLSQSPTITSPAMTGIGMLLGTAAYMAPEQAKGRPADKRSDIWAFGCVLYEMLTGTRAFGGDDVADTLANVLKSEPDWNALPPATPGAVRTLLRRCLTKDRKRRLDSAAAARLEIDDALTTPATEALPAPRPRVALWRRLVLPAAVAVVAASLAGSVAWKTRPVVARPVARFAVTLTAEDKFKAVESTRDLVAVSPDGSRIVYAANSRLYVRRRDQLASVAIAGTGGGRTGAGLSPFFSPDGQWLGFWQEGQLKKISVNGGAPIVLCAATAPWGASWASDDTILYGQGPGGIWRVSASGGAPENLVKVDAGERAHGPQLLPGGRALLFTLVAKENSWDDAEIVVQSLDRGARQVVVRGGTDARYLPTGHIVYALRGSLLAVPFDAGTLEVTGGPVALVDDVAQSFAATGAAHFSVSGEGTLVYVPASSPGLTMNRRLVWIDRMGRETPVAAPPRMYGAPKISPDGEHVIYQDAPQLGGTAIWIYEFRRGIFERLTSDPGRNADPIWSPDGRSIAYAAAARDGGPGIFVRAADGTGDIERLTTGTHVPSSWSPDGTRIVYADFGTTAITATAPTDLAVVTLTGDRRAEKLLATPARESQARIAPDGRWLAYETNETGEKAIFVRPFPAVSSARWSISSAGGSSPVWARDGRTLFYRNGQTIMAVAVRGATPADWGTPEKLFEGPYVFVEGPTPFDVAPDGRFLMVNEGGGDAGTTAPDNLIVVQNWFEELRRLVPTR